MREIMRACHLPCSSTKSNPVLPRSRPQEDPCRRERRSSSLRGCPPRAAPLLAQPAVLRAVSKHPHQCTSRAMVRVSTLSSRSNRDTSKVRVMPIHPSLSMPQAVATRTARLALATPRAARSRLLVCTSPSTHRLTSHSLLVELRSKGGWIREIPVVVRVTCRDRAHPRVSTETIHRCPIRTNRDRRASRCLHSACRIRAAAP
mmetsp:Transcript_43844/g.76319  ORF Transcript_43844/g.76319 Transcript_43844/m.76319 type:complete len:203 (-) Transcript_43844:3100-3708(-)